MCDRDAGSDDIEPSHTRSRSFDRRPRRPVISSLSQHIQTAQADDSNAADTARGISSRGNHSLIGLSPLSPLPHAMLPTRKRSLEEVLGDQSRPEKDKLSAEIDELAGKQPPSGPPESSSSARDISATGSHQRKKSRTSGEPSITRALPVRTRSSATNSEEHGNRGERRRSQRIRNASHHDKPSSSS